MNISTEYRINKHTKDHANVNLLASADKRIVLRVPVSTMFARQEVS
jgi:hypothetical protein